MFQFTHPGKGATRERAEALSQKLVSIHAPWEGCDFARYLPRCEGRFQFTHPGKGATRRSRQRQQNVYVSIHAPWEGCDALGIAVSERTTRFNSRTLGRVRRHYPERYTKSRVSIHAPWEGCDDQAEEKTCEIAVSIHAPWEGCDAGSLSVSGVGSSVSIHAPWEGCDTAKGILECKTTQFQFTHPGKGATTGVPMSLSPSRCFNSRTLGRVRLA